MEAISNCNREAEAKVEGPAYLSAWLLDPNLRRSEARVDDL